MRQWRVAGTQRWLGHAILSHGARQYPGEAQASASTPGTPIGRVGLSGKTEFPHLHFSVRLHDKKVDPFAYGQDEGACAAGRSLWDAALRDKLSYRQREIVNFGFADGPVSMSQIKSGEVRRQAPKVNSPALVAYVRAIGLKAGR